MSQSESDDPVHPKMYKKDTQLIVTSTLKQTLTVFSASYQLICCFLFFYFHPYQVLMCKIWSSFQNCQISWLHHLLGIKNCSFWAITNHATSQIFIPLDAQFALLKIIFLFDPINNFKVLICKLLSKLLLPIKVR